MLMAILLCSCVVYPFVPLAQTIGDATPASIVVSTESPSMTRMMMSVKVTPCWEQGQKDQHGSRTKESQDDVR